MLNDERDVDFAARGNHMTRVLVRGAAHGPTMSFLPYAQGCQMAKRDQILQLSVAEP